MRRGRLIDCWKKWQLRGRCEALVILRMKWIVLVRPPLIWALDSFSPPLLSEEGSESNPGAAGVYAPGDRSRSAETLTSCPTGVCRPGSWKWALETMGPVLGYPACRSVHLVGSRNLSGHWSEQESVTVSLVRPRKHGALRARLRTVQLGICTTSQLARLHHKHICSRAPSQTPHCQGRECAPLCHAWMQLISRLGYLSTGWLPGKLGRRALDICSYYRGTEALICSQVPKVEESPPPKYRKRVQMLGDQKWMSSGYFSSSCWLPNINT